MGVDASDRLRTVNLGLLGRFPGRMFLKVPCFLGYLRVARFSRRVPTWDILRDLAADGKHRPAYRQAGPSAAPMIIDHPTFAVRRRIFKPPATTMPAKVKRPGQTATGRARGAKRVPDNRQSALTTDHPMTRIRRESLHQEAAEAGGGRPTTIIDHGSRITDQKHSIAQ